MQQVYAQHRQAIDKVVVQAQQYQQRLEDEAASSNQQNWLLLSLALLATVLVVALLLRWSYRRLIALLGADRRKPASISANWQKASGKAVCSKSALTA
jgi:methyl-accepting chemotaxis protein